MAIKANKKPKNGRGWAPQPNMPIEQE